MTGIDLLQTVRADIDRALTTLHRMALDTDAPALGVVEAADYLDAARAALAGDA